jgi:ATP-dependent helicase HrpB
VSDHSPAKLPIYQVEADIVAALRRSNRLILAAPTGSGKTTQVPPMLLRHGLAGSHAGGASGGGVLVLEPRRLATRLVAERVAGEMGCRTGELVGYQTRHDSKVGPQTRLRFITEGLFQRLLQSDRLLSDVGAVVLDEFHERSLAADAALAMLRLLQEDRRPDLKLIVMSATLDVQRLQEYLACPVVEAKGRLYPVDIHYLAKRSSVPCWDLAAEALLTVLESGRSGDVLVFMPGAYEIRRTIESCRRAVGGEPLRLLPLHGELPTAEQDRAVRPTEDRQRKVIVATNVAETSITIEGVSHVIDSGLARVQRFDPRRGINVLDIEPISQGSAEQRAGRAGRLGPGTCLRLWTEGDERARPRHTPPEVRRLDLAEVLLQLLAMGVRDLEAFPWLEAPGPAAVVQATSVLRMLDAIDDNGPRARLTDIGRQMARLPMHPRPARMLVEAVRRNVLPRAALWAALLSERNIVLPRASLAAWAPAPGEHASDFVVLERALEAARAAKFDPARCTPLGVHAVACREVDSTQRLFRDACRRAGLGSGPGLDDVDTLIKCLLVAFPDHLAVRKGAGTLSCALSGKRRGEIDRQSVAKDAALILPVEISEIGTGKNVRTALSMASAVDLAWLDEVHPGRVRREVVMAWNADKMAVERLERVDFDDLVIDEAIRGEPPPESGAEILADLVVQGKLVLRAWDDAVEQWIARVRCVGQWFPERRLITYDEQDQRVIIEEICRGAVRYSQIEDRPCLPAVRSALSWEDQQFVEQMAPDRIALPGAKKGWKMKVAYSPGAPPRGRAKIQDLYGLKQSPSVAAGRQRVLLEILGPNFRPLQTTDDLAGFWKNLYPTLKKELSRKYPRHEWR